MKKNKQKESKDKFDSFWKQFDEAAVKKFEKDFEDKVENSKFSKKFGYFITALINIGLLWLFKSFPDWTDVLTYQYAQNVLWLFNILFVATAIVNIVYLFLDKSWFRAPTQLLLAVVTFFTWFNLYHIWPFDFSGIDIANFEGIMRGVVIFILVVISFSAIWEFFTILFGFKKKR